MKTKIFISFLALFISFIFSANAVNYYWVNASGNWSDPSHWSTSSGGPGGSVVPGSADNVFFDANSGFTAVSKTVTIDVTNAYCRDMNWTGSANTPTLATSSSLNNISIYGSLTFISAMTNSFNGNIYFKAITTGHTITTAGRTFNSTDIYFDGIGGGWTLQDGINCPGSYPKGTLYLNNGNLNTNGQTLNFYSFNSNNSNTRTLTLGATLITLGCWGTNPFDINCNNLTLNAGTSTIQITGAAGGIRIYGSTPATFYNAVFNISSNNVLNLTNSSGQNCTFNNVTFNNGGTANVSGINTINGTLSNDAACTMNISGTNNISIAVFNGHGNINGTNTFGNLTFSAGKTYTLQSSMTQTITGTFTATGACGNDILLKSSSAGTVANISKTSGTVNADWITLRDNNATGGATFNATNATTIGTVTGWNISPPSSSGVDFYWISGAGNWNDPAHWSLSSGGAPNVDGCIPGQTNNVYFDANSGFTAGSKTVTINLSTASCKDMDWTGATNNPILATSSSTNCLKIYGSLIFISAMTNSFNCDIYFEATTTGHTITTGGLTFSSTDLYFNGIGGGWTLTDGINCPGGYPKGTLYFNNGNLNTNGQTLNFYSFNSNNTNTRTLTLGATLITLGCWGTNPFDINCNNLTFNSGTSTIQITGAAGGIRIYGSTPATFYNAVFNISSNNVLNLTNSSGQNCTFNNVTFNNGGTANVSGINTINGTLSNDAACTMNISGTNNISIAVFNGHGNINGTNTFGNLTFSAGKTYTLQSSLTQTITGTFNASGACGNSILIKSSSGGTVANISKASGTVNADWLTLQDNNATGGATFNATNSTTLGTVTGWNVSAPGNIGLDYYWIGGTGNWNDPLHWSLSSGGAPNVYGCIPGQTNSVYFDANSGFTAGSKTVTINISTAECFDMDWTGAANNPILATSSSLNCLKIYGSLTFISAMTNSFNADFYFRATSTGHTITTGGLTFSSADIYFDGIGGGWTLQDGINCPGSYPKGTLYLNNGNLNTNGQTLNFYSFNSNNTNTRTLSLGASLITLGCWGTNPFDINCNNLTLNTGTSTIQITGAAGGIRIYGSTPATFYNAVFNISSNNVLNLTNSSGQNCTFNNVIFNNGGTANVSGVNTINGSLSNDANCTMNISGANNIYNAIFNGHANINGTNSFGDLTLSAGKTYTLQASMTQTLTGNLYATGIAGLYIQILSSSAGVQANISKSSGNLCADYLQLKDNNATGGATFYAGANSINVSNNSGWIFSAPPPLPAGVTISANPSGAICAGDTVTFSASITNGGSSPSYQWQKNGDDIAGETDTTYSATNLSNNDTITCIMTSNLPCVTGSPATSNSIIISVSSAPAVYSVTGGGAYCSEDNGVAVGLSNSENGVEYQLILGGTPLWAPIQGNGTSISFGDQIGAGTYTVIASDTAAGCQENMSGNAVITINFCYPQNKTVSINTTGIIGDTSSILDVNDTASGVLLPRLSDAQRDNLNSPASGLLIYNITTNNLNFYTASGWYETGTAFVSGITGSLSQAGGVSVNNSGIAATNSAILDINDSGKGLLIPRTIPEAITVTTTGLIIFNANTNRINYYNGAAWVEISASLISTSTGAGSPGTYGCSINYNGAAPDPSSILDISAINKGILIPRITTNQRNNILPATGLIIFNLTNQQIEYFNGTNWLKLL